MTKNNKLILFTLAICRLIATIGFTVDPTDSLLRLGADGFLSFDAADIKKASSDFGMMARAEPMAVLHPRSADDVARAIRAAAGSRVAISARGHGHSINGQAMAAGGLVMEMSRGSASVRVWERERFVDVWGGELWIDVLNKTLEHDLAPKSWTDYLYLTVGGTLSNAGISGQTFNHGPQIRNVHELDVVTGKGELLTCSEDKNSDLFHAVLGGLGQFGIITRARIALEPAPKRVRWIRVLYSKFSSFTKDQEFLISLHGQPASKRFDYVEGFVIVDEGLINNWRSSFFSPQNPVKLSSINSDGGVLYCLEITKNYDESNAETIDEEIEALLKRLEFIPSSVFTTDLVYVDFLDRVHKAELKLRSKGLWDVAHPWFNLFVPKSRISDFDNGVFKTILGNKTSGPILIYPMNKDKWDDRSSAVTPDEEVFYLVALLRSAVESEDLEQLQQQNRRILKFCSEEGIQAKQYLPHYTAQQQWAHHFGPEKWAQFQRRKMEFDPHHILATGQRIFTPNPLHQKASF